MNQQDRQDLQLWLDGELDEQRRAAWAQRIAEDPEVRAELALLKQVGESLQRSFAVPNLTVPNSTVPNSTVPNSTVPNSTAPGPAEFARRPRWPLFLAGAVSAAAVLLVWLQPWNQPARAAADPDRVEVMRTAVGRSWLAVCGLDAPSTEACASPSQLAQYIQPLTPEIASPLGWREQSGVRFQRGLEPKPQDGLRVIELLVLPRTEVFLFVVPAAADPRPVLPPDTDWNLFRKPCGLLVVYELTPLDKPHGLQCLTARP